MTNTTDEYIYITSCEEAQRHAPKLPTDEVQTNVGHWVPVREERGFLDNVVYRRKNPHYKNPALTPLAQLVQAQSTLAGLALAGEREDVRRKNVEISCLRQALECKQKQYDIYVLEAGKREEALKVQLQGLASQLRERNGQNEMLKAKLNHETDRGAAWSAVFTALSCTDAYIKTSRKDITGVQHALDTVALLKEQAQNARVWRTPDEGEVLQAADQISYRGTRDDWQNINGLIGGVFRADDFGTARVRTSRPKAVSIPGHYKTVSVNYSWSRPPSFPGACDGMGACGTINLGNVFAQGVRAAGGTCK